MWCPCTQLPSPQSTPTSHLQKAASIHTTYIHIHTYISYILNRARVSMCWRHRSPAQALVRHPDDALTALQMLHGMPEGKGGETRELLGGGVQRRPALHAFARRIRAEYYADGPSTHWSDPVPQDILAKVRYLGIMWEQLSNLRANGGGFKRTSGPQGPVWRSQGRRVGW
jgi:hypothetical protein